MKLIRLEIMIFQSGDLVRTPEGVGIVTRTENITNYEDIRFNKVLVQHKSGISGNPSNDRRELDRSLLIPITLDTYEEDL